MQPKALVATGSDRSNPPTNPDGTPITWRPGVTEAEARCIGEGLIDRLGAARVRDLNLGLFPWHLLGYSLSGLFESDDAEIIVDTFKSCSPTWELLMILSATQGTEWISEASAECTRLHLNDSDAQSIFVAEWTAATRISNISILCWRRSISA